MEAKSKFATRGTRSSPDIWRRQMAMARRTSRRSFGSAGCASFVWATGSFKLPLPNKRQKCPTIVEFSFAPDGHEPTKSEAIAHPCIATVFGNAVCVILLNSAVAKRSVTGSRYAGSMPMVGILAAADDAGSGDFTPGYPVTDNIDAGIRRLRLRNSKIRGKRTRAAGAPVPASLNP